MLFHVTIPTRFSWYTGHGTWIYRVYIEVCEVVGSNPIVGTCTWKVYTYTALPCTVGLFNTFCSDFFCVKHAYWLCNSRKSRYLGHKLTFFLTSNATICMRILGIVWVYYRKKACNSKRQGWFFPCSAVNISAWNPVSV